MKDLNKVKDLTGKRFGKLVVIGIDDSSGRKTYWFCKCDCGNTKRVRSDSLQNGSIKSCGCLKKEQDEINLSSTKSKITKETRGYASGNTRLYEIWQGMKRRCYNDTDARYCRYGGRGITVCDEWRNDFGSFHDWALENGYNDELTIDRIDNNGNYEPNNCRWSTMSEQCRNRSTNINIKIGNATKTLAEWCKIFDVPYSRVSARYHRDNYKNVFDLFNG